VTEDSDFRGWAILELMGHRRLAGLVAVEELAGASFFRIDVPGYLHTEPSGEQEERGGATQFYSASAVYCLTPTTEEVARQLAERARPAPVQRWELSTPRQYVPEGATHGAGDDSVALDDGDEDVPF